MRCPFCKEQMTEGDDRWHCECCGACEMYKDLKEVSMFKRLSGWFQRHPGIKTTAFGLGSAALTAAAAGTFGPKVAAASAGVTALIGLFIRRPQDAGPEAKAQ